VNKILNLYILTLALFACNVVSGDVSPDDIMFRKPEKEKTADAVKASATTNVEQSLVAKVSQAEEEVKLLEDRNAQAEAEIKALKEKLAEEKAEKEKAQKRVQYMLNPEPDERPLPKKETVENSSEEEKPAVSSSPVKAMVKVEQSGKKAPKKKKELTGREAVITADRTDYDRKEGIILFDRNVYVDDEQYQMHADRLFVFLDGTNDLKRLVAIGNVSITNDDKTASCTRATYHKASHRIVMYGNKDAKARLHEGANKGSTVLGDRITFWLNSEQVEIEGPAVTLPGGAMKGKSPKDLLK
jgi:lipopolysaccharide transport protein LptA